MFHAVFPQDPCLSCLLPGQESKDLLPLESVIKDVIPLINDYCSVGNVALHISDSKYIL